MKLLGSNYRGITKGRNGKNLKELKITEVILVHCNVDNNKYQYGSIVSCLFLANKSFCQLRYNSPINHIYSGMLDWELSYTEVWFTDHNSKLLEDRINLTLVKNDQGI